MKTPKYRNTKAPKEIRKVQGSKEVAGAGLSYPLSSVPLSGMVLREDSPLPAQRPYDLEERTALFGEAVIRFVKKLPQNAVNARLISQLVGSATSIGANYCEADNGVSGRDFRNKIGTCRKEARETKFFLRMIAVADDRYAPEARDLWREAKELHLIFSAIYLKRKAT